eukprot:CAMPEP_0194106304 /NCGR_PEP_ID=MMETSP0150-20130528/6354_1 /TAXON_ID=122233 /ORGANISM="Chaetoceros debilis, Strain MM31A-1" /LENGTH=1671 /DNA_ID=CAMNT_0038794413 /DNA_START=184 /DNA_END=5196 /DNA_ORIENTATION=+
MGNDEIPMEKEDTTTKTRATSSRAAMDNNGNAGDEREAESASLSPESPPRIQQAHMGLQRDLTKQLDLDLDLTTMTKMQIQRQPSDELEGQAEGQGMGQDRRGVEELDVDLGHHQHMPSSMSGYDTARQTPTPKYGGSFISSSSDSNTFSGATVGNGNAPPSASPPPTAIGAGGGGEESKQARRKSLMMPCSPEDSEVHHSYPHVDMDANNIDADASGQPPLRTRTSSEDHEHVGAGVQNQLSGSAPKFYDTEIESVSGSLIYGGSGGGNPSSNNFRKMMMRNNSKRLDSLSSFGNDTFIQLNEDTDGDDGDPDLNDTNVGNSGGQGQQHPFAQPQKTNPNTPNSHKNAHSQGSSTGTPYTSNLTKGGGLRQNHDRGIGGGQDVVEPVLPYHKRKQLTEQQKLQHSFPGGSARGSGSNYDRNMEDVHGQGPIPNSGRKSRRAPELSTITAPAPLRRSPNKQQTQNHSNNSNSSNNSNPHPYHGQYQNQLPPMSGGGGQYGSSSNNNNYAQPPRNRSASDNDYNNNNGHQPPRHPKNLKKSHSHDPGVNGNYYNNDPNSTPNAPPPASSSLARPPALHVRVESSGSVSSLGSLTGGASITRREGRKLAQRLGLELQEYQDHGAGTGTGTGRDHRQDHDDGGHGHGHGHGHGNSHSHRGNNNSGRGHGHTATGRTRERHDSEGQHDDGNGYISTFLKSIDFTTEGSFTSFGSVRSVEDEKADYRKKGQKFLKKAEKERARQERKNNKGGDRTWIPGIGDKGRTIRSLSPANRSQHEQNRSRLPSIDNDNWEEDDRRKHKKQNSKGSSFKGSSKGGGMKKKLSGSGSSGGGGSNHNHHRPPIRNKRSTSTHGYGTSGGGQGDQQHSTNLGSSGGGSGGRNSSSRSYRSRNRNQPFNPNSRERGGYSDRNRNRSHYQSPSESENSSEEEESCISSDFTSNRFDSDGEDSSVYVDDSEAASTSASEDDYLSYGDDDDDDDDDEDYHSEEEEGNERTTLLPSGDNTDEYDGRLRRNGQNNLPPRKSKDKSRYRDGNNRRLDRDSSRQQGDKRYHRDQGPTRYDSRNKSRSRKDVSGGGYRDRDSRDLEYGGYDDARARDYGRGGYDPDIRQLLHEERLAMEKQMRKAMMEEWQKNQLHNRFRRWVGSGVKSVTTKVGIFCTNAEAFISNLPLTIGAVALAVVTMGVVWFKFSEEMMDSCMPVHFHSDQCNFPEFPGCFYCDTSVRWYRIAYGFHNTCTAIALVISLLFLLKIVIARNVVIDEMNSPTTSSPAGLICMTLVCVCAGRGMAGQIMVSIAAAAHFCLALWFIYMASAYNILPDPSWYPNTVGIGISAVKTWLYYPMLGHFLMLTSMTLFSIFYPISLFRVAVNKKLSAPVSWIQMSAPAVSLYALTIMAQPSFEEEHPDITDFQRVHRMLYLPAMHFFFVCTILGALSSVQSLIARWDTFSKKPFSPAHAAFCFPTLAHANAVQAYRGAIDSFSDIQPGSPLKIALFCYWFFVLIVGTLSTFIITAKFFYMLPSWTRVDIEDEIEPPQPHETLISEVILAGETYRQNFVSPAVLQANETGALIQIRERGKSKYVRTRRVTALGFEPIMNIMELQNEREKLLEWVEKNPPRQRKRTLSVPGITIPGSDFGSNNVGVYGAMSRNAPSSEQRRRRAQTSDGNYAFLADTLFKG